MKETAHPTVVTWPCHHPSLNHKSYSEGPAAGEGLCSDPGCRWVFCSFQGKLLKVFLSRHSKGKRSFFKERRSFQRETRKEHKITGLPQFWRRDGKGHGIGRCEQKAGICRSEDRVPTARLVPTSVTPGHRAYGESGSPRYESSLRYFLAVAWSDSPTPSLSLR